MLNCSLHIRCDEEKLDAYKAWCESGKVEYQQLIREFIELAPKGLVKFQKTDEQKEFEKEMFI